MALKGLYLYLTFLFEQFAQGKVFTVTGIRDWVDYNTKQILGTKVEVTIFEDKTAYPTKNGKEISNLYEKMYWKVPKTVTFPVGTVVVPVGAKATVFGEFKNQLSVTVDDIKAVRPITNSAPTSNSHGANKSLG